MMACAGDANAESGQDENVRQGPHSLRIAGPKARSALQQDGLVGDLEIERRLHIAGTEQSLRHEPVDLRWRPTKRIAEPGRDQPGRRSGENLEVEERARRGRCAEAELE